MESITDGNGAAKSRDFSLAADRLLGRVNGTMRFLVWGSRPMGSLLGGDLGSRMGLLAPLAVGAFGMLIAFVPVLASPIPVCGISALSRDLIPSIHSHPQPPGPEGTPSGGVGDEG